MHQLTHTLDFRVWAPWKVYQEEADCWKVMAEFCLFQEALDYAERTASCGVPCAVQTLGLPGAEVYVYPRELRQTEPALTAYADSLQAIQER
jgi:hypothetical protein